MNTKNTIKNSESLSLVSPAPSPLAPQTVTADRGSSASVNKGRQAQSILDPMQALDDENKDILG